MKSYKRSARVSDLILREVAICLQREVHDPRLKEVSLIEVNLNSDMSKATIFFTVIDKDTLKEVTKALNKASGFFRHQCSQALELRYVPQIEFVYDASIIRGAHLSRLLDDVAPDDEPEQPDSE
ncbi:MAG: 30S ribosome-binding factor RbfA [Coxiellaceae bacterium]|nr:30S ribosome-binding factor RbfA [Coxiellaceae bacterium]